MSFPNYPLLPFFAGFTAFTPEVPKLYWDVKSQEQRYFTLCKELHKMICFIDAVVDQTNDNTIDIGELQDLFKQFMNSGFDEYYEEQVTQWITDNLDYIFTHVAKSVYFGLNDQGYFVAYIPESWNDIIFDTGMDYNLDTYGRLILRWNVDNSNYTVNQAPEQRNENGK